MLKLLTLIQRLDHDTMMRENILLIGGHLYDINQTVAHSDMWCHEISELLISIQYICYL